MMKIAIDGPAGAGKSTIAKAISARLGYTYIDTGAMYRSVGLYCTRHSIPLDQEEKVAAVLDQIEIDLQYDADGFQQIFLCGENVSSAIRSPQMSAAASAVALLPCVRIKLVELQRQLAQRYNVVMDGRDIGTYVLPDADVKIFLCADVAVRAHRRYLECVEKGMDVTETSVLEDMKQRDYNDSHREFAPLRQANDAVVVDTTQLSLEASIESIYHIVKERLG